MKKIGKIKSIDLSYGGYRDAAFGLNIAFTVKDEDGENDDYYYYFDGPWAVHLKWRKDNKWTEQDRTNHFGNILRRVNELVDDAKVNSFSNLKNIPVEIELDRRRVESFRILKEVL